MSKLGELTKNKTKTLDAKHFIIFKCTLIYTTTYLSVK